MPCLVLALPARSEELNKANKTTRVQCARLYLGGFLLSKREVILLDKPELLIEIGDILEEIKHGAEIGITLGNMGHDTSEDFKMLVVDFLGMKKEELEDELNG